MTKAIDPFEEFLRKKKVEILEQKYRGQKRPEEEAPAPAATHPDEDPETEARLKEEMDDFFQSGQSAGAKLFNQAQTISDDKVDEIKDALDDVFEDDAAGPEVVDEDGDAGDTFVNFFKQVQEEFDEDDLPASDSAMALALEDQVVVEESEPEPVPPAALRAAAHEIGTPDAVEEVEDVPGGVEEGRLDLTEILRMGESEEDLRKQVEVLSRLVAKLVERSRIPESDIIEALIRAGVEF